MNLTQIALLLFVFIACSVNEELEMQDEILWHNYGVLHIYARSDSSLYYMADGRK